LQVSLAAAVAAAAPGGAVLSNCGWPVTVSKDRMAKAGQHPQSVACNADLVGQVGKTSRCEALIPRLRGNS